MLAFEDLRARTLLGIHRGTSTLPTNPWRSRQSACRRGIAAERAWIVEVGETRPW